MTSFHDFITKPAIPFDQSDIDFALARSITWYYADKIFFRLKIARRSDVAWAGIDLKIGEFKYRFLYTDDFPAFSDWYNGETFLKFGRNPNLLFLK